MHEAIFYKYRELETREHLDSYLSAALDTSLVDGKLPEIDEAEYVLTLDYTVKVFYTTYCHMYVCIHSS